MNTIRYFFLAGALLLSVCSSCSSKNDVADASGTFEANEIIVSSEATGKLVSFSVEEGETLTAGTTVATVDNTQLVLRKKQLQLQVSAILSKQPDAASQLATLQEQIAVAKHEYDRFEMLQKQGSSTKKTVDDIEGQMRVLQKNYESLRKNLDIITRGLQAETLPLLAQIEQVNDQLAKCSVVNPIDGVVLSTYAEQSEVTTVGKSLYKIANLSTITLRAFISGALLSKIKLGNSVRVYVDSGKDSLREYKGTVTWVASKAEFTPKTIQTKEERANLVYAIKIAVPNDGSLKIGMYGEVRL